MTDDIVRDALRKMLQTGGAYPKVRGQFRLGMKASNLTGAKLIMSFKGADEERLEKSPSGRYDLLKFYKQGKPVGSYVPRKKMLYLEDEY